MELENDGFQKETPFPWADFQVNHVKLQGCIFDVWFCVKPAETLWRSFL